jgi:hypothetical protein
LTSAHLEEGSKRRIRCPALICPFWKQGLGNTSLSRASQSVRVCGIQDSIFSSLGDKGSGERIGSFPWVPRKRKRERKKGAKSWILGTFNTSHRLGGLPLIRVTSINGVVLGKKASHQPVRPGL